jgi:hypothetical protein
MTSQHPRTRGGQTRGEEHRSCCSSQNARPTHKRRRCKPTPREPQKCVQVTRVRAKHARSIHVTSAKVPKGQPSTQSFRHAESDQHMASGQRSSAQVRCQHDILRKPSTSQTRTLAWPHRNNNTRTTRPATQWWPTTATTKASHARTTAAEGRPKHARPVHATSAKPPKPPPTASSHARVPRGSRKAYPSRDTSTTKSHINSPSQVTGRRGLQPAQHSAHVD